MRVREREREDGHLLKGRESENEESENEDESENEESGFLQQAAA